MTWRTKMAMLATTILATAGSVLVAGAPARAVDACQLGAVSVINGTPGNDVIVGTDDDEVINGGGGNDQIFGRGGVDIIFGGGEADVIFGGDCADLLMGGSGDDVLAGEGGDDRIAGDAGADTAHAGPGSNFCVAENLVPAVPVAHAYEYFGPTTGGEYWGQDCNEPY